MNEALRIYDEKTGSECVEEMDRHTHTQLVRMRKGGRERESKRMNWTLTIRRFIMNFWCARQFLYFIHHTNEFVYRMDFSRCYHHHHYWSYGCCFCCFMSELRCQKRAICNFSSAIVIRTFLVGLKEWARCFSSYFLHLLFIFKNYCRVWTITYVHIERYLTNHTANNSIHQILQSKKRIENPKRKRAAKKWKMSFSFCYRRFVVDKRKWDTHNSLPFIWNLK